MKSNEIFRKCIPDYLMGAIVKAAFLQIIVASASAALPVSFDWRQVTTLPPVQNQLSCGSCWAFCSIDVMETAIYMQLGDMVDLSEQWLVSCTQGGDGCNGGAIGLALNSLMCSGTGGDPCGHTGAVLEEHFPYTATHATACQCPYQHPYCIESWSYVNQSGNPTNDQIRQAIYDHGPVACHMEVYQDLSEYRSGIYKHIPGVNPAVKAMVIVGWGNDGSQNYWIVKNTWGTWWGDKGYGKVAFDTCGIGKFSVYVGTVKRKEPKHFCGELGQVYLIADLDKDCHVGLSDLAILAANWMKCTDLSDPTCSWD